MLRYLILCLVVLAACAPVVPSDGTFEPETGVPEDTQTEPIDNGPLPPPVSTPPAAPEVERQEIAANTDGYNEWANDWRTKSYVVVLVSDGEKAARAVIPSGHSLYLATNPAVNVSIGAVGTDGSVMLIVDEEQEIMHEREDKRFKEGQIIVFVDEVYVR